MSTPLESKQLAKILTYLGTLPFWYGILSALNLTPLTLELNSHLQPFDISQVLMIYTLVILSFIAGIHWGFALNFHEDLDLSGANHAESVSSKGQLSNRLLISSNVIALWAWIVVAFFEDYQAWLGLAIGFVVLLLIDKAWIKLDQSIPWFWTLRWHASLIAITCLLMNAMMNGIL
ncbi:DUF3429 domain-containing protein [Thiomicrorhabdus sp. Milos-T2]|uniref:DUF3429 domain-containing protein n=1 Tax=Thiomicrorhabdus sp. Milos-T2 TaxID=90814 RepID=UPI000493F38F|nr:DUF3429 domain-containing protein [Thiomicrorhabdus sp. Milos-T2]